MKLKIFQTLPFFLIFLIQFTTQAQNKEEGFGNPLPQSSSISSVFGEPRSNHFHSGIDFRTNSDTGLVVVAPYDGSISRIKVGFTGYGNALYLEHSNGLSTVYGHLERFAPAIESHITKVQYANQKNDIEDFPERELLCIQKGDTIGFTGNTGGSTGPHLHYEIRETKSQNPIDPIARGLYYLPDNIAPVIARLIIYEVTEIDGCLLFRRFKGIKVQKGKELYTIENNGLETLPKKIAFGLIADDRINEQKGTFAIASAVMKLDGQDYFGYNLDEFSYTETRFANAFIDYEAKKMKYGEIVKLFAESNCPISVYRLNSSCGVVTVDTTKGQLFEIKVMDHNGNSSRLQFALRPKSTIKPNQLAIKDTTRQVIAIPTKHTTLNYNGIQLTIPEKALYAPTLVEIKDTTLVGDLAISRSVAIGLNTIPLQKPVRIELNLKQMGVNITDRVYLARLLGSKGISYAGGIVKDSLLSTSTREFGVFALARDTTPPLIKPRNFQDGENVSEQRYLYYHISDSETGVASYQAYIDGEWAAMYYEPKEQTLRYNLSSLRLQPGLSHNIRIVCTDQVGNITELTNNFIW